MPIDFRHAERAFVYRDEQGEFSQLPLITKTVAVYLIKIVDMDGGYLPLRGREPWDAVRVATSGECGKSDRRILKRAIAELLDEGHLERGVLVNGEFLPHNAPQATHIGIRNWVPAQQGWDRKQTAQWHVERDERIRRFRDSCMLARQIIAWLHGFERWSAASPTGSVRGLKRAVAGTERDRSGNRIGIESELNRTATGPESELNGTRTGTESGPNRNATGTESGPNRNRTGTELSVSTRKPTGTDIALFHAIPDHSGNPPIIPPPGGDIPTSDRRSSEGTDQPANGPPVPAQPVLAISSAPDDETKIQRLTDQVRDEHLAREVIGWLNRLHRSHGRLRGHRGFDPLAQDALKAAKRWRKRKLTPQTVIAVCEHRIAHWRTVSSDWLNNCTPSVLFRASRFDAALAEVQAGHKHQTSARPESPHARNRDVRVGAVEPNPPGTYAGKEVRL